MNQILAIDIDDVLADAINPFLLHVNQIKGLSIKYDECFSRDYSEALGISKEEIRNILINYETPELIAKLKPIQGATENVKLLAERYHLIAVTSRSTGLVQDTNLWIKKYFPMIGSVHYSRGGGNILQENQRNISKREIAERLGALCLIDDNVDEFLFWDPSKVSRICFAHPWNYAIDKTCPNVPRLKWPEIRDLFL